MISPTPLEKLREHYRGYLTLGSAMDYIKGLEEALSTWEKDRAMFRLLRDALRNHAFPTMGQTHIWQMVEAWAEESLRQLQFPVSEKGECLAKPYSPNGGASQEQRWQCEECGDVTDTMRCPKGRQNSTLARLAVSSDIKD